MQSVLLFVHLYFNIIGTVLFLTLYSILNAVIHFPFANDTVGVAGIALIHSIFNIFATVVLFRLQRDWRSWHI